RRIGSSLDMNRLSVKRLRLHSFGDKLPESGFFYFTYYLGVWPKSHPMLFTEMVTVSLMRRFTDSITHSVGVNGTINRHIKMFVFKSRNGTAAEVPQESRPRLGRDSAINLDQLNAMWRGVGGSATVDNAAARGPGWKPISSTPFEPRVASATG